MKLYRVELAFGVSLIALAVIALIAASTLDDDAKIALLGLLAFLGLGFGLIPLDQWLDNRRDRRDANRRNHVRK